MKTPYKSLLAVVPLAALACVLFGHGKPQPVAASPAPAPLPAHAESVSKPVTLPEFDSMRMGTDKGFYASWKDEHDLLPGRVGPPNIYARTFINAEDLPPPAVGIKPVNADDGLPPTYGIPIGEAPLPGTMALAESKAARELGYGAKLVKAPEAWAKNKKARGAGVKVAVLDTGCDVNHVWLKDNIKGTYNAINKTRNVTDVQSHGTHCAGIVLESLPEAEIYVVKVLGDNGSGSVVDIAHGIDYAVQTWGVDVVSLSLGGPGADSYIPAAFARAELAGTIISCAAGNEGPGANTDGYPARYPQAISVAACNEAAEVANFSSRGQSVYCLTPGVGILSSLPGNKQGRMSGTSMATPLHSALAGMWVACSTVEKKDRPTAYRASLRASCKHPNTRVPLDGYGLVDATKLVPADSATPPPVPPLPPPTGSINFGPTDLTPEALARLKTAGITGFSLSLEFGAIPQPPPAPTPMPPGNPPVVPVQPAPPVQACPGGVCSPASGTRYAQPASSGRWEPFGGVFRLR